MKCLVFGSGTVRVRPDPVFGPRFLSDTQTTHFGEDYTGTYQGTNYLGEWHCTLFDGTNNLSVHFVYAPEHKAILLTRLGAHGRTNQDRT